MTTYNTGNPLGSQDPRDLFDNARNMDHAANSQTDEEWVDRLGAPRKTWYGIEQKAQLQIDRAEDAADAAIAAASAIGPIKFYGVYGQALADVANIPNDGLIEVSRDETRDGARTRYFKRVGNVLEFSVNLDQLRIDLKESDGASRITYQAPYAGSVPRTLRNKAFDRIHVRDFGGVGNDVDDDTVAFEVATVCAKWANAILDISGGHWVVSDTWVWPEGIVIEGSGAGQWLAWTAALPKKKAPSQVRFVGLGNRKWSLPLVTDQVTSGGVISNPSSRDANDHFYRLTSFTNANGSPRLFSCAVKTERSGRGIVARGFRIVLDHDGINGYNDPTNMGLGADWDVGFWNESGQNLILEDVQVVGYWRMFGQLQTAVIDNNDITSGDSKTGAEYSRYIRCAFQGAVGVGIRGGDIYRVTEVGADYVGIEYASNLPFNAAPTGRLRVGSSALNSVARSYTAVTFVGGNLRLTIGDTTGITVGNVVTSNVHGFGLSNTVYEDCEVTGLGHASQYRATALGFTKPSACIEISGTFLRGISFRGTKPMGVDDVVFHSHECADVDFDGQAVFESKAAADPAAAGTIGGRVICSPAASVNTRVPNPAGSTDRVRIDYGASITNSAVDMRPFSGLTAPSRFNGVGDVGFFAPQSVRWMDRQYPMDRTNTIMRAPGSGGFSMVQDQNAATKVRVGTDGATLRSGANAAMVTATHDGTQVLLANTSTSVGLITTSLRPILDGAVNLGAVPFRFQDLYLVNAPNVTSDATLKTPLAELPQEVLDAWGSVRIGAFRWLSAIAEKGDAARFHVGVIAQEIVSAFSTRGLDATKYGIVSYESWEASEAQLDQIPAQFDDAGNLIAEAWTHVIAPAREAGGHWTVRATECHHMEAAYLRRELANGNQLLNSLREEFDDFKQSVLNRLDSK